MYLTVVPQFQINENHSVFSYKKKRKKKEEELFVNKLIKQF